MGKAGRCLIHMPVGAFNAWLFLFNASLGWAFLVLFVIYELNEDWHIKDHAWRDIVGWLWGFAILVLALLILSIRSGRIML